ncbi:MAG: UDP-N-acetylmuramate--alanine ligase [Lautropia sp.]
MPATRSEIAAQAAQLIADGGLDYQSAKRRAARDVLGDKRIGASQLPDNDEIDACLREHLALFDATHDARIARYRAVAALWMTRLHAYNPYVTGAAWKGIVAPHAQLHLQLFTDDQKELEIRLIDDGIQFDVSEIAHFAGGGEVTALSFEWEDVPVLLSVYAWDDLRGALRRRSSGPNAGRADRGTLAQLREREVAVADGAGAPGADADAGAGAGARAGR